MNSKQDLIILQTIQAIRETMQSIATHGLRSLKDIPVGAVTPLSVTQSQALDGCICVNYLHLPKASEAERTLALRLAVYEEYCGIFGISLERRWRLENHNDSVLVSRELSSRLMNSMVFILKAPEKIPYYVTKPTPALCKGTHVAFYESHNDDAFSGDLARHRFLIGNSEEAAPSSPHIVEIKTPHSFLMSEVHAALVPRHLCEVARVYFKDIRIIPVPITVQCLRRIPQILEDLNQEKMEGRVDLEAPDYLKVLDDWQRFNKIHSFSIHAVRLPTPFDWVMRPVASLKRSEGIIQESRARIIASYDDDSAWVMVHKAYASDISKLITHLERKYQCVESGPRITDLIRKGSENFIRISSQLLAAKENGLINKVSDINPQQLALLTACGFKPIPHPTISNAYYVYCSEKHLKLLQSIVKECPIVEKAGQTISSVMHGFWSRKRLGNVCQAKIQVDRAEEALTHAQHVLETAMDRVNAPKL